MAKVRIVTDSSAHFINPAVARQLGITVIPLEVQLGERVYRDGIDIDAERFFLKANDLPDNHLPTVSAPSPETITQYYLPVCRENSPILSLHLSRSIHPMWSAARAASQLLLGPCDIEVMDSQSVAVGLGMMAEAAARMAENGLLLQEIVRSVRKLTRHVYAMFYLESLNYLRRGGLMSESQIVLGTMLDVRPFVTIEDGDLMAVEKVKTRAQAIDRLVEFASEFDGFERIAILHSPAIPADFLRSLQERLIQDVAERQYPQLLYQPSLACFLGMDAVGLFIHERYPDSDRDSDAASAPPGHPNDFE
jgi:DegV family protein with EDD domain